MSEMTWRLQLVSIFEPLRSNAKYFKQTTLFAQFVVMQLSKDARLTTNKCGRIKFIYAVHAALVVHDNW